MRMQERPVVMLAAALTMCIAVSGLALPTIRFGARVEWRSFDLSVSAGGEPSAGSPLPVFVDLRQGMMDPKTLWVAFLSLDVEDALIVSGTPGTNPWGYATVWNITDLDLTTVQRFAVTVVPQGPGTLQLRAMVWTPRGDLRAVAVAPSGHVNPAGISVLESASQSLSVT